MTISPVRRTVARNTEALGPLVNPVQVSATPLEMAGLTAEERATYANFLADLGVAPADQGKYQKRNEALQKFYQNLVLTGPAKDWSPDASGGSTPPPRMYGKYTPGQLRDIEAIALRMERGSSVKNTILEAQNARKAALLEGTTAASPTMVTPEQARRADRVDYDTYMKRLGVPDYATRERRLDALAALYEGGGTSQFTAAELARFETLAVRFDRSGKVRSRVEAAQATRKAQMKDIRSQLDAVMPRGKKGHTKVTAEAMTPALIAALKNLASSADPIVAKFASTTLGAPDARLLRELVMSQETPEPTLQVDAFEAEAPKLKPLFAGPGHDNAPIPEDPPGVLRRGLRLLGAAADKLIVLSDKMNELGDAISGK